MKYKRFLTYFFIVAFLNSCYIDWDHPNEILTFMTSIQEWTVEDSTKCNFVLLGSDSTLLRINENYSYSGVTGYTNGVKNFKAYVVEGVHYEQMYLVNGVENRFYVRMQTPETDHGDLFTIYLLGTYWAYDFSGQQMNCVLLTTTGDSESVHNIDNNIQSSFSFVDSILINNIWCDSIMHFSLNLFNESWSDSTVTELYYAKHVGLVKFQMNNGFVYERIP